MKNLLTIIFCCSLLLSSSCKKGDPGTNGTNGNANVESFTFLNQSWVNSGQDIYVVEPAITQAVIDKGVVDVYIRQTGTTGWEFIPNPLYYTVINVGYVDIYPYAGWGINPYDVKIEIIPSP